MADRLGYYASTFGVLVEIAGRQSQRLGEQTVSLLLCYFLLLVDEIAFVERLQIFESAATDFGLGTRTGSRSVSAILLVAGFPLAHRLLCNLSWHKYNYYNVRIRLQNKSKWATYNKNGSIINIAYVEYCGSIVNMNINRITL